MKILAAVTLLVASALANPGPGSGYGPYFSPHQLNAAAELAHRVANEKEFLLQRIQMLRMQQNDILSALDNINDNDIPNFNSVQAEQNARLAAIRAAIKEKLHVIGDLEADLAGEVAVTTRQERLNRPFWESIEALQESNNFQNGQLAKIQVFLQEAEEKLDEKLESAEERAEDDINAVQETAKGLANLVNTRQCVSEVVHIDIYPDTAEGSATADFSGVFGGNIPAAYCALQGFVSKVKLDQTQQYGYGNYGQDEDQSVSLTIDCKPSATGVDVRAFDQSRGKGNGVYVVYVQVKACSFGPVS